MCLGSSIIFDLSLEDLTQGPIDTRWPLVEGWQVGAGGSVEAQLPHLGLGHFWGTTCVLELPVGTGWSFPLQDLHEITPRVVLKWPTVQGYPESRVSSVHRTASLKTRKVQNKPGKLVSWGRSTQQWRQVDCSLETWKQLLRRNIPLTIGPHPSSWTHSGAGTRTETIRKLGSRSGLRIRKNNWRDSVWHPQKKAYLSFRVPGTSSCSPSWGLSVWARWGEYTGRHPLPGQPVSPSPPFWASAASGNLPAHCVGWPIMGHMTDTGLWVFLIHPFNKHTLTSPVLGTWGRPWGYKLPSHLVRQTCMEPLTHTVNSHFGTY